MVIRTVPSQMYYTPQWMKRMEHWLSDSSLQQMVRILQHHEQSYHRIQRFIENRRASCASSRSSRLSRWPAMRWAADWGRSIRIITRGAAAAYFTATVGQWMAQQEPDGIKVQKSLSRRLIQPENVRMPSPIVTDIAMSPDLTAQPGAAVAAPKIILPGDLPPGEGASCELRLYRHPLPFRFPALYRT